MTINKPVSISFALALAMAGCSASPDPNAPAASAGDEATPEENIVLEQDKALTDEQMLQVLTTVDTGEIAQAQLAVTKSSSPQVRNFASEMIEQHNRAKQQGALLASQTKLSPTASRASKQLQAQGATTLEKLQSTDPGNFDQAYMKAQVKQHQDVINMLDTQLIPAATNPDLHNHLVSARGMVDQHLRHAKQLTDSLPQ
ncbi:MAG: DUF4142 domain-containing protein [Polyangiales bacterium]